MLRAHAPLIAVSTVVAIMFYLVFRDLRAVRSALAQIRGAQVMASNPEDFVDAPDEDVDAPGEQDEQDEPGKTVTPPSSPDQTKPRSNRPKKV